MFAAMMWGVHFSPLFNASLEDPLVHDLEHALFLGGALLFWWPAVALDPAPYRLAHPARIVYVFLQKPRIAFGNALIKATPEGRETYLSRPSTEAARTGTNFSGTIRLSGGHVKTFSLPPDWKCFSFAKDAPYRGDGFAYFLVGYRCGKTPSWQTDSAMTAFLQMVSVK
jgi:cytochrome c oxidase assembly factor CtaG